MGSANTPWNGILEKGLIWGSNPERFYSIVVFTVFARLSQVWGGICSRPTLFAPNCPIPISRGGDLKRHCGNLNNASDIIKLSQIGNFSEGYLAVPIWEHAYTGVTNDPLTKNICFFSYLSRHEQEIDIINYQAH